MRILTTLVTLLIVSTIVSAHHSAGAVYDMDQTSEIEGEIVDISWSNPHIRMTMRVNESGTEEIWHLEAGALNTVQRLGVATDDINVGDRIRVAGYSSRDGHSSIFVSNALLDDGRELLLLPATQPRWRTDDSGQSVISAADAAEAVRQANGLFRVWTRLLSVPPFREAILTGAAETARNRRNPTVDDPTLRCEQPGMIEAMVTPSPIELILDGTEIVIRMEEWDQTRRIHMGEPNGSTGGELTPLGHSIGYWDDGELVVTTTRISWPYFDDEGTPQSDAVVIVERFRMNPDETLMTWEAIVTDPENLAVPAHVREEYVWVPGEEIKPYDCALPSTLGSRSMPSLENHSRYVLGVQQGSAPVVEQDPSGQNRAFPNGANASARKP